MILIRNSYQFMAQSSKWWLKNTPTSRPEKSVFAETRVWWGQTSPWTQQFLAPTCSGERRSIWDFRGQNITQIIWWCQNWSRLGILSIMIVEYCSWSRLYSETYAVVFGNLYSETNTVVLGNLYSETNAVVFGNLWQELMIHHVLGTKCLFPLTCMWVLCRSFVHTPAFDELGTRRLQWSWSVVRIQIRLTCEIFSLLYTQWQWNGQVVKYLNLNLDVGSHAQVQRRSQVCFVSYQNYACICQNRWQVCFVS